MNRPRRQPPNPLPAAGFTLIELLVTISIIVLLVGISVPVALRMLGGAEVGRTRSMLIALSGSLDEYKLATGHVPDHTQTSTNPKATSPVNNLRVSDDDDQDTTIGLFFVSVSQLGGTSESMMRSAVGRQGLSWDKDNDGHTSDDKNPPDFQTAVRSGDITTYLDVERWTLLDSWDSKLRYAARVSHDDSFTDDDYLPAHPTPFFASAGQDGLWGDADLLEDLEEGDPLSAAELEEARAAEDNIYSFEIE